MQSQVSEISPVLFEVKVQVPWDHVNRDLETGYTKMARTAHVKGFRPGKVPVQIVKQLFKRQVEAEVVSGLVEKGLLSAIEEHKLALAGQPEVEAPSILKGEPLSIIARIEVRPQITEVELGGIEVYADRDDVAESDVDAEIERLREANADLVVPDPIRPAKQGDVLVVDFTVAVDGEPRPDMSAEGRSVELGSGRLLEEFDKALVGANPGDVRTAEHIFPEDHANEAIRGKKATFTIAVKEIKEKVLPELDDEFAKDCGNYETLSDLRTKLRQQQEEAAERRSETSVKDQIIEAVVSKNEIPVPPSMLKQQKQQMLQELLQIAQYAGGTADGFLQQAFEGIDQRAERRVRAGLLLGAVARLHEIKVTDADVDVKLQEMAEKSGKHVAKIRAEYQGERREMLENQLLEQKIMDFLRQKVALKPGKPPAPEAASAGEEKADAPKVAEGGKKSKKKKSEESPE